MTGGHRAPGHYKLINAYRDVHQLRLAPDTGLEPPGEHSEHSEHKIKINRESGAAVVSHCDTTAGCTRRPNKSEHVHLFTTFTGPTPGVLYPTPRSLFGYTGERVSFSVPVTRLGGCMGELYTLSPPAAPGPSGIFQAPLVPSVDPSVAALDSAPRSGIVKACTWGCLVEAPPITSAGHRCGVLETASGYCVNIYSCDFMRVEDSGLETD